MLRVLAIIVLALPRGECFFEEMPLMESLPPDGGDPGQPLFLTPYIEAGNLEEGRRLARVSFPDQPNVESYSGFVTVNTTYNSNLFFWYFPNETFKMSKLIGIELQSYPGVSSLFAQFEENGVFRIVEVNNTLKLKREPNHFSRYTPVIYLDHAVGAGFSFTNDSRGYCTSQEEIGDQLYSAVFQIVKLFPELQKLPLMPYGELAAGKFAVSLARAISLRNQSHPDVVMRVDKMRIYSGWIDPISQMLSLHKITYQTGLHDWRMVDYIKQFEYNTTQLIKQEKWLEASNYFLKGMKNIRKWSGGVSYSNYMKDISDCKKSPKFVKFVQTSLARQVLHVGDLKFQDGVSVRDALKPDLMKSVLPSLRELAQTRNIFPDYEDGLLGVSISYHGSTAYKKAVDPYVVNPKYMTVEDEILESLLYIMYYGVFSVDMIVRKVGNWPIIDSIIID